MALPTEITISGLMLRIDGTPEQGHVTFQSTVSALSSADETVMVPSLVRADLDITGAFEITVPASDDPAWTPVGWVYNVNIHTSGGKTSFKTVVPYDAVDGLLDFSDLVPSVGGGSELYATFSHTHGVGGGVTTWDDITGKPATFTATAHTHTQADVTGLTAALTGKAATVHTHLQADVTGLSASLTAKADTSALDIVSADVLDLEDRVSDLEAAPGGGSTVTIRRATLTGGNYSVSADAGWVPVTSGPTLVIPAVVDDEIELRASCLVDFNAARTDFFESIVLVSGSAVRFGSTNTSSGSTEGDPAAYPGSERFNGVIFSMSFKAEAGDISGGNITFGMAHKGAGGGAINANTNYPFRWTAINYGPSA